MRDSHLDDYPPGTDTEPCWIWKGGVRTARPVTTKKVDSEGRITTYHTSVKPAPVARGGRDPMRIIARKHGLRLMDLSKRRTLTCEPLCVNPYHRIVKAVIVPLTLLDEIRAFLPQAQSEDDIFDEFLLRGFEEEEISHALEKLHDHHHP